MTSMKNFKKDRILLFKTLQKLIEDNIKYSTVNVYDDADIAEVIIELQDKKRKRMLKQLSKAMEVVIKESEQESKRVNEQLRKPEVGNVLSKHFNLV